MKSEQLLKNHMGDLYEPKENGGWCIHCLAPFTTISGNRDVCDLCREAAKSCKLCGTTDMKDGVLLIAAHLREGYCRDCKSKIDADSIPKMLRDRLV